MKECNYINSLIISAKQEKVKKSFWPENFFHQKLFCCFIATKIIFSFHKCPIGILSEIWTKDLINILICCENIFAKFVPNIVYCFFIREIFFAKFKSITLTHYWPNSVYTLPKNQDFFEFSIELGLLILKQSSLCFRIFEFKAKIV